MQQPDSVTVARTTIGQGLFARRTFRKDQDIMKIVGRVVDADLLWDVGGKFADNCYRFGPETYLDPGDHPGRYVNHSCAPNAAIRKQDNQLFLFAARPIRRGEEIVIDYSTILGADDIWTMRCRCGTADCRRVIRRYSTLSSSLRRSYESRGMVPPYILRTLQ